MDDGIDATAYADFVGRDDQDAILALVDGAHFAHCSHEDCAINAWLDQHILDRRINIDITFLAADNTEAASILVVRVHVLVVFDIDTFVKTVQFV